MAGQRVVKRAHSNCEDEAIKENPVKRFFATKIAVNATGWIDPLKDHLSRRRMFSTCEMYISTIYKHLHYPYQDAFISSCLGKRFLWILRFPPIFCLGFPISMVPSFHPRRPSTQLFFFIPVFFTIEFLPVEYANPRHHRRHPIQAQAALKVLEKYWSCICVFLNFPRPLYPLTSRRSVDVEANKKPSQLGGWKNYTAFSSHSSRANWRGNVSIVPFHCPLFEGLRAMKWRWKWFVAIGKPQIIMLCGHLWDRRLFVWTNKGLLTLVTS